MEEADEISPLIPKSFSSSNVSESLYQRVLNNPGSITTIRRMSTDKDLSLLFSRPQRLIGNFKKICNWKDYYVDPKSVKSKLRGFYEKQNELIEKLSQVDKFFDDEKLHYNVLNNYSEEDDRRGKNPIDIDLEGEERESQEVMYIIMVNFFINFLLLVGKIIIALLSNSMTLIASLVDSVLDFLSTFIIYVSNRLSSSRNNFKYPVGKSRLNPLSVLVLAVVIIVSFLQIIQESFKKLLAVEPILLDKLSILIMTLTILLKFGCYIYCLRNNSTAINALAQDAKFDVIFNLFSIIIPVFGIIFKSPWLDPLGAIFLSIYIISEWSKISISHINNLTGANASEDEYKTILYLCYRFSTSMKKITALKVYHVGDNLNVEIDVVFNDDLFKDNHDTAESLQYVLETVPFVERAFVHIDYMQGNYVGHLN